ncbi:MAG: CBS domain-containing protein [Nitrospiraceae bacterium]
MTLDEAVNQFFLPYGYGGFPVVEDGRLVGIVTVREVQSVPNIQWFSHRVADVMAGWIT